MRVEPETWTISLRHYRSRFCLLYLLWSLSPSYSSRHAGTPSETNLATGPPVGTASSLLVSSAGGTVLGKDGRREVLGGRTGPLDGAADQQFRAAPVTPPFDPTTADISRRDPRGAAPASSSSSTYMPVKGSTSCDVNTSLGRTVTPSLSEKPPAVSNAVKPPSTQAEGGRPDVQRDPPASPSPPPLPRLNPLHITLLHLHALYAVRFALHAIRNSVTTALIANPLPPPFAPANASASFAKRIGRFHWRMSTISRRCGTGLLAWLVTMGGLLAFLVKASSISSGAQGWNVVACAGWVGQLRLADSLGAVKAGARGWAPLRNVVLIEIISNLLQAFLAIMPLLVSLGWAPSAISASFLLHSPGSPSSPPPAGSYRLPTDNFLSAIISPFATNLLTILQVLQLVLARSPSHRWFNFSTLIVLNAILLPLEQLAVMREKKANEAERIAKLAFAFPRRAARRGTASRDAELEGTCLVCFEGTFEPDATVGGARRVTFITACELPCGHTFHAACLARWFALVSTCPACHRSAVSPPSTASPLRPRLGGASQ